MDNRETSINIISSYIINDYNAIEITIEELIEYSGCIYSDISKNTVKVFKIDDKEIIENLLSESEKEEINVTIDYLKKNGLGQERANEECYNFMNDISTGKLIIVTLESEDNSNLSGFTMQGSGEKLYKYLLNLMGENLEKDHNPLDETIYELKQFRPYGKYFK